MLRLLRAVAAFALVLAIQASIPLAGVEARSTSCAPHGSRVVHAAEGARLYSVTGTLYACRHGTARRRIGHLPSDAPTGSSGYEDVGHARLQPRWVAWASIDNRASTGDSYFTVTVQSLVSGTRARTFPTGKEGCSPACPSGRGVGPVTQLKLDASGSVGWIAQVTQGSSGAGYEVWAAPRRGAARRVAAGPDVDKLSLRLWRGRLTWRQAGTSRTSQVSTRVP